MAFITGNAPVGSYTEEFPARYYAGLSIGERREILIALTNNLSLNELGSLQEQARSQGLQFGYIYGSAGTNGERVLLSAIEHSISTAGARAAGRAGTILQNACGFTIPEMFFSVANPSTSMAVAPARGRRHVNPLDVSSFFAASRNGATGVAAYGQLVKTSATSYGTNLKSLVRSQVNTSLKIGETVGRWLGMGFIACPGLQYIPVLNVIAPALGAATRLLTTIAVTAICIGAFTAYDAAAFVVSAALKIAMLVTLPIAAIAVIAVVGGIVLGVGVPVAVGFAVASPVVAGALIGVAAVIDILKIIIVRSFNELVKRTEVVRELENQNTILRQALSATGVQVTMTSDQRTPRQKREANLRKAFNWTTAVLKGIGFLETKISRFRILQLPDVGSEPILEVVRQVGAAPAGFDAPYPTATYSDVGYGHSLERDSGAAPAISAAVSNPLASASSAAAAAAATTWSAATQATWRGTSSSRRTRSTSVDGAGTGLGSIGAGAAAQTTVVANPVHRGTLTGTRGGRAALAAVAPSTAATDAALQPVVNPFLVAAPTASGGASSAASAAAGGGASVVVNPLPAASTGASEGDADSVVRRGDGE